MGVLSQLARPSRGHSCLFWGPGSPESQKDQALEWQDCGLFFRSLGDPLTLPGCPFPGPLRPQEG